MEIGTGFPNDARDVVAGFYSDHAVTANIMLAMRQVFEISKVSKYEVAYQRAAQWLETSWQNDTQGYALKVMALTAAQYANDQPNMATTIATLFTRQNPDGGFGRFETRPVVLIKPGSAFMRYAKQAFPPMISALPTA